MSNDAKIKGMCSSSTVRRVGDGVNKRYVSAEDWFSRRYTVKTTKPPKDPRVKAAEACGLIAACRRVGLAEGDAETRAALDALEALIKRMRNP